jgi:DNA adenine methylase
MDAYRAVQKDPDSVSRYLRKHSVLDSEAHYYRVRNKYNSSSPSAAQAGRFIYLNKTSFNGIFRVNRSGAYNVPYGWKEPPCIPTRNELRAISGVLAGSDLRSLSFEVALDEVDANSFVYLDPPYPPLTRTSYFTHYTAKRFGEFDQRFLAEEVARAAGRGAKFMMTNADTPLVRELYKMFRIAPLTVTRSVTCKAIKHSVGELVITNYPTPLALA